MVTDTSKPTDDTRARLIDAAGDEFARVGFSAASLRDICATAGVNVSSVKYHFGSKEDLYLAVWEVASDNVPGSEPMPRFRSGDDPEHVLREFVAWFMRLVIVEGRQHAWTGRLLSHEMLDPTSAAFRPFVEKCCEPVCDEIRRLVIAISGNTLGRRRVDHLVYSVIAMCTGYKHYEKLYDALGYDVPGNAVGVNRLAAVVADLAIGGLRSFDEPGGV